MGDPDRISKGDWTVILHAPYLVYRFVAAADGEPLEAQFRRFSEEIGAARGHFSDGTIGAMLAETLAGNLDAFWAASHEAGRSPKDGLKRVKKALRKAPEDESIAIRDWLVTLGIQIADARREVGADAVSPDEVAAIRDIAGWVDRPALELAQG